MTAADPSTIWLEFPAVTLPSATNDGWSAAIFSTVVSRRTASSTAKRVLTSVVPESGAGTSRSIGMISFSKRPSSIARAARMCDSYAYRSRSSRERFHFAAISSAEMPCITMS